MDKRNKRLVSAAAMVFLCSTLFFLKVNPTAALTSAWIDEKDLGRMCINHVLPAAENADVAKKEDVKEETAKKEEISGGMKEDRDKKQEEGKEELQKAIGEPKVIIYHTHSTESYMPYKESNYHREKEEGTVRDVGNVLEKELEKKGINVIHDKTIHDRPSYNESYGRSLSTIKTLMKKYPTAEYVIDLHRDAAPSSAKEGKILKIGERRVAKFSLVVGRGNENYVELYGFAKKVSQTAEKQHKGFGGPIIEKEYRYNGFVSNKAILLEVGNNKNTIEECRATAEHFAEVMEIVIKEKS